MITNLIDVLAQALVDGENKQRLMFYANPTGYMLKALTEKKRYVHHRLVSYKQRLEAENCVWAYNMIYRLEAALTYLEKRKSRNGH